MKKNHLIYWTILFCILFLLSQDYLFVQWENSPSVLGFPRWIYWFAFVHFLFIGAFFWFSKKYWKE